MREKARCPECNKPMSLCECPDDWPLEEPSQARALYWERVNAGELEHRFCAVRGCDWPAQPGFTLCPVHLRRRRHRRKAA